MTRPRFYNRPLAPRCQWCRGSGLNPNPMWDEFEPCDGCGGTGFEDDEDAE